jgi:hypothetical protein
MIAKLIAVVIDEIRRELRKLEPGPPIFDESVTRIDTEIAHDQIAEQIGGQIGFQSAEHRSSTT